MKKYGEAAIAAVNLIAGRSALDPREAWEFSTSRVFGKGTELQMKSCPRGAFLGLCEAGLIADVPSGNYTRSRMNKQYAIDAVAILRRNAQLAPDKGELWSRITAGKKKAHNNQLDVVLALWRKGLIGN